MFVFFFFFFFQAEDGIRDRNVTGVQTCALPISLLAAREGEHDLHRRGGPARRIGGGLPDVHFPVPGRSEERRVGKECRSRWARYQSKKKVEAVLVEHTHM